MVSTRTGGGAMSMSIDTPAEAMVGTVIALAAMHRPKNSALREAFIDLTPYLQCHYLNGTLP
jgi:hypothetical protein